MGEVYAADVVKALEARFNPAGAPRQFATFTEVTDESQRRRVDFLAVNMWLSRGRHIEGVEVKVRRPDWLKELRNPKADSWFSAVNRWWLAAPQGVAQIAEIPPTWGFLEVRQHADGYRLFVKREAPVVQPPAEWPGWLVMRLLKRVEDVRKASPAELEEARLEGMERGERYGRAAAEARMPYRDDGSREVLQELITVLGGESLSWRPTEERIALIRRAVQVLDEGRLEHMARNTARLYREAAEVIEATLAGVT